MNPFTDKKLESNIAEAQETASETFKIMMRKPAGYSPLDAALSYTAIREQHQVAGLISRAVIGGLDELKKKMSSDVPADKQNDLMMMADAIKTREGEVKAALDRTGGPMSHLLAYIEEPLYKRKTGSAGEPADARDAKRSRVEQAEPQVLAGPVIVADAPPAEEDLVDALPAVLPQVNVDVPPDEEYLLWPGDAPPAEEELVTEVIVVEDEPCVGRSFSSGDA